MTEGIMARKVFGKITNKAGQPLPNVVVEAWDSDNGPDDFMGRDTTDSSGSYTINYAGRHWDPFPHRITKWRPDIYIKVFSTTRNGHKVKIDQSKVYNNQKLKNDRRINLKTNFGGIEKHATNFIPETHGLPFQNSFSFKVGWKFDGLGFCGGMCAFALHRFNKNIAIPANTPQPQQGDNVYTELLCRQIASLFSIPLSNLTSVKGVLSKLAMPHTLFQNIIDDIWSWQKAPDEGHWNREHSVGHRTKRQWPALKERLKGGKPTILVLITQEGVNPALLGHNHQVLATGYEYNPGNKDLVVKIYDPNNGRNTEEIYLNLGLPNSKLDAKHSNPNGFSRVRGFFVNPLGDMAAI